MSDTAPVRVLVVDDSATVRAVVRRLIARSSGVEVVGEAADGADAVEATLRLRPDLVLMDIEMPRMDGFRATERIMELRPTPILVLTSRAGRERTRTAYEAIRRGAVEVLPKPADTAGWEQLATTLPEVIHAVATARTVKGVAPPQRQSAVALTRPADAGRPVLAAPLAGARWPAPCASLRYIAVGASTGGPTAVRDLLAALPGELTASVLVVQHIAAGFESSFAEWLAADVGRDVQLAREGERPAGGEVRIGPAGAHLLLAPDGTLRLDAATPPHRGHRPSADHLFGSCARSSPHQTAGVLLTGMGCDGAEGLLELRRAGGATAAQDEASSVVFGMPRAAIENGAAQIALPPAEIGAALRHCLQGAGR
jgi:two-component system, chemotaxis family, protein-glutamate methylesterase/glutaminase